MDHHHTWKCSDKITLSKKKMQGIGQELYTNCNYVKILTKIRRAHGIKHLAQYLLTLVLGRVN